MTEENEPNRETEASCSEAKECSLEAQMKQLDEELRECKDKYLRLLAEAENTRKRMQKEKQEMMRFSTENVIADFLTPMDNLENALKFTQGLSPETLNWVKGFEMILAQFHDVLSTHGVSAFHTMGSVFDPHMHEAVEVEETDASPEGTVVHEYVKGYKSPVRTIRPARVKVAKASTKNEENPT